MINSQEIKIGTRIRLDGKIWACIDFQHRKLGEDNTVMITRLKNVSDGHVLGRIFQIGSKLEDVRVERRPYQYLYEDTIDCVFMNQETFEQIPLPKSAMAGGDFMKEGDAAEVVTDTSDGSVLLAKIPVKIVLRIAHSGPGIKGDTATNVIKPATFETGVEVRIPLFVSRGELTQVDTRDGNYLNRVSE